MFIGHFALGFASKKNIQSVSLGTAFIAVQLLDLLWPLFLVLGWEYVVIDPGNTAITPLDFVSYPISHSLLSAIGWGLLFGLIYYLIKKNKRNAIILGLLVVSHWVLDLLTHRPDLPLTPWGDFKVGLGLWNSFAGTVTVEGLLFIVSVYIFLKSQKPDGFKSWVIILGLVLFLVVVYVSNLFGPPPPSEEMIGYVGFSQWLLVLWGYWIDRQKFVKT